MEKLFIRLERPIPGVDHLVVVDPERFATLHGRWDDIAPALDVDRINDLYVYEGEYGKDRTRWFRASRGLKAVRVVIDYYRSGRGTPNDDQRREAIEVFQAVEIILDKADSRGIRFCFVGDY